VTPYRNLRQGVQRFGYSGASAAPLSTLLDGLVSYWALDETSGTRVDAVGENDLTDNNTTGYDTGVNGNAANLVVANNEYLSNNAAAGIEAGPTGITFSAWFKTNDASQDYNFLVSASDAWDTSSAGLLYQRSNKILFQLTGGTTPVNAEVAQASTDWRLVIGWWDAGDGYPYIVLDGGDPVKGTYAAVGATSAATKLRIGAQYGLEDPFFNWNGLIDEVAIWSRVLTEDERAELYNSGSGKFYPFT